MSGPRLTEPHHGPGYDPERHMGPPWDSFEEAVEYYKRQGSNTPHMRAGRDFVKSPSGGRGPPSPPVHPNCRSSHLRVNGEDVGKVSDVNISVEGDLTEKAQEAIKDAAEEALERSKNLLKR